MKNLTKSAEDYIEAIYMLRLETGKARSTDIATRLGVSKPAVNKAMNDLNNLGFISNFNYSDICLTESGEKIAKKIYAKHILIYKFLISLGVSDDTANLDCCKIEHVISEETTECIKKFLKQIVK